MSTVRRMTDEELPAVLALLAQGGGTPRTPETWAADRMAALVLAPPPPHGSPVAAMPLARRTLRLPMMGTLNAGWLSSNQFASKMSLRRQTRETAAQWAELLPEVDTLLIMRRDEASLASRWYARTGFEEILSIRCLYLEMEAPPAMRSTGTSRYQVQVATPSPSPTVAAPPGQGWDAGAWQSEMLAVYTDVYGSYGGPRVRTETFWAEALAHHFYREHYQFQIIGLWNAATLMGYAVVGWSGWHSKRPRMDILELATRQWDTAVAADLIQTTCQLAWSKNVRQVRAVVSSHDPYRGHLTRTGFEDRWGYLMLARWLHPQKHLERLSGQLPAELGDVRFTFSVPGQVPLTLVRGAGTAQAVSLETTSKVLTRLLLNRLDIGAAGQEGVLSGTPLTDGAMAKLSAAFPWTPWAFHMLDYI